MTAFSNRATKDSGDPWFGEVPVDWEITRLKFVGRATIGLTYSPNDLTSDDTGTIVLRSTNIQNRQIDLSEVVRVQMEIPSRLRTRSGDILICSRNGSQSLVGKSAWISESEEGQSFGAFTTVFRSPHNRYLFHLFNSGWITSQAGAYQTSTIFQLTTGVLNEFTIALPSEEEQRVIAAFLDRKTAQIDAVVAKKQRLIERLQEKRQALISHAVTKGLDPHAPMKDSGIEWLGEIPRHWTAERLKFSITKIEQGWSPQCDNRQAEDGEWGVLKVGCVNRSEFDSNEQKALPEELAPVAQYEIGEGDILMSRGNTRELVGSAALVKAVRPKLLLCDLLYRFRSRPQKADSQFLVLQLRSPVVRYQIEREATGTSASMKKIGQETIRSFWIVLPPIEEQQRIIVHIAEQAEHIDKMTDRIRTQISKLQEYRQTLISAAVTGKIEVTKEAKS